MKNNHQDKVHRIKRTMTLPEDIDYKIRILAANKRIPVGTLVQLILQDYFDFNMAQRNE